MARAEWLRAAGLSFCLAAALAGGWLYLDMIGAGRTSALDWTRTVLLTVALFWLLWGGFVGVLGALSRLEKRPQDLRAPRGLTAILVPIYNEDPLETFARVAAMNRQLVSLGMADRFHFAILSDSTLLEVAAQEALAFDLLVREPASLGRIFYRRRERNVGKKAGNIEDFIARSGGAYDYALILDADSLMDARTIVAMARRMDEEPRLGLLQTVPEVIDAGSVFGRMMAFSSAYLSPYFARGIASLQGGQGPYWGHNAIVRLTAFAACCGLPVLSGKPPSGGHILSHDYVEAALLARGGWTVEVDPLLGGSYENGPDNMIEHAKRDRRWCQGNLQHRRLLGVPGLRFWSRFTFVQGIMAYMVSPLWLLLLVASMVSVVFPDSRREVSTAAAWILGAGVLLALLAPKLAIFIRGAFDGHNRRFGGNGAVALSLAAEVVVSTLVAPVLLAFQSRAVFQVLLGIDGGWPATERSARRVSFANSLAASWWICLMGLVALGFTATFAPAYLIWLIPVAGPAVVAPAIIWLTSFGDGRGARRWIFATQTERDGAEVITENDRILAIWRSDPVDTEALPARAAIHAPA